MVPLDLKIIIIMCLSSLGRLSSISRKMYMHTMCAGLNTAAQLLHLSAGGKSTLFESV